MIGARRGGQVETKRHQAAFAFWLGMAKPTFAEVAREFGVSQTSVKSWAKKFDWVKRQNKTSQRAADLVVEKAAKTIAHDFQKALNIVREVLDGVSAEEIAKGATRPKDLKDIVMILKELKDVIEVGRDEIPAWVVTMREWREAADEKVNESVH